MPVENYINVCKARNKAPPDSHYFEISLIYFQESSAFLLFIYLVLFVYTITHIFVNHTLFLIKNGESENNNTAFKKSTGQVQIGSICVFIFTIGVEQKLIFIIINQSSSLTALF